MKTKRMFLRMAGTAVLLFFSGLLACNDEPVIEPVMTLYDKPLSTIKKVIEGRWQWYVTFGGFTGKVYHNNTFVEFRDDLFITEYDGRRDSTRITWKKLPITSFEYDLAGNFFKGYRTYIMWNREENVGSWYFDSITNDTLHVGINDLPPNCYDCFTGDAFVRVK